MIDARHLDRLANILARLDSPFDGERAAAGLLASRTIRKLGVTWPELLQPRLDGPGPPPPPPPPPGWHDMVELCLRHPDRLSEWETGFLNAIARRQTISPKQADTLRGIAEGLARSR